MASAQGCCPALCLLPPQATGEVWRRVLFCIFPEHLLTLGSSEVSPEYVSPRVQ